MNEFLYKKLSESYDEKIVSLVLKNLKTCRKTTFRINRLKTDFLSVKNELDRMNIKYETIKSFEDAFIIDNENSCDIEKKIQMQKSIIESNMYKNGEIYMQSLSSMIPVYILNAKSGENILDMCAAPGSKTTFIESLAMNKVNLTAIELHKDRFERLKYNINLQAANVYVININALQLDDNFKFDKILLDAPCSGSGTLDISNDNYEKYFTDVLIKKCIRTQQNLIKKGYKLLKKGGELVYSTCSLLKEENEEMIDFAKKIGFKVLNIDFKDFVANFDESEFNSFSVLNGDKFIKVMPDDLYEGFFVAKFIKAN